MFQIHAEAAPQESSMESGVYPALSGAVDADASDDVLVFAMISNDAKAWCEFQRRY